MPYPERRTVLPLPNHGTFQLNPIAGAQSCRSLPFRFGETPGFGEFFPTNCTCVRLLQVLVKPIVPGLDVHVRFVNALSALPMNRASRPLTSHGWP